MSPISQMLMGIFLAAVGALHRFPAADSNDQKIGLAIHSALKRSPWIYLFKAIFLLGRTEIALFILAILIVVNPLKGIIAALTFLFWSLIDRVIKLAFKRVRPFDRQPGTQMLQAHRPSDPSFPSGDAYHAWFLALAVILIIHPAIAWIGVLVLLAVLVSLGRIVLGVHFPLDVIAGSGIGIAAAGFLEVIFVLLNR